VRGRGERYSSRLENLIASVNWAERLAFDCGCSAVICAGDFFDANIVNSEEISALREIQWSPISHVFITGNHEGSVSTLDFSTMEVFNLCPNSVVINSPEQYMIEGTNVEFCYLPYVLERDRKSLREYFGIPTHPRIIFSHNDIKDIQYGQYISQEGFAIGEIEGLCDLYLNGHLHHCACVTDKVINIGNLTGQNFTEDAHTFEHCALIVDTDTMDVKFYINPYAYNFYKLDCTDCTTVLEVQNKLSDLKPNAVLTIKVNESIAAEVGTLVSESPNISAHRLLIEYSQTDTIEIGGVVELTTVDHLKQFEQYVLSALGNSDVVKEELSNILR
jgi:DNA repair exonuclease SbcCD nuclease subunit